MHRVESESVYRGYASSLKDGTPCVSIVYSVAVLSAVGIRLASSIKQVFAAAQNFFGSFV